MGRAYEVRKASIEKNGAQKAKLYSNYAKEIYQAAKNGIDANSNDSLKRLIEKAKREQIPADIINRAIDKVKKGITEDYKLIEYEGFGPGGSNLIIKCLTDNINRTISYIRPAFNKTDSKIAGQGAVSYLYDNLCVIGFEKKSEEEILELMIENDIDIEEIEIEDNLMLIYGEPKDLFKIKNAIENKYVGIKFEVDEIGKYAKELITLSGEDLEVFRKLINMLEEVEDVSNIFHNVSNI